MLHTNNPIIKLKAGFLNLAEELGNVSRACKVMGVPCDTFCRCQELVEDSGINNLIEKSRRVPNTKHRIDEHIKLTVPVFVSVETRSINPAIRFFKNFLHAAQPFS